MRHIALATIITAGVFTPAPARAETGDCYAHVRSDAQFRLVARESRGNPLARNRHSTAFGCGQLLRATRRHFAERLGVHPDTTRPGEQMRLMGAYTDARYGSDERALAHSLRTGWY